MARLYIPACDAMIDYRPTFLERGLEQRLQELNLPALGEAVLGESVDYHASTIFFSRCANRGPAGRILWGRFYWKNSAFRRSCNVAVGPDPQHPDPRHCKQVLASDAPFYENLFLDYNNMNSSYNLHYSRGMGTRRPDLVVGMGDHPVAYRNKLLRRHARTQDDLRLNAASPQQLATVLEDVIGYWACCVPRPSERAPPAATA